MSTTEYLNITVQTGWHYSSHEMWKLLQMPFLDDNLVHTVHLNGEKLRTLNSNLGSNGGLGSIPGMYASTTRPSSSVWPSNGYNDHCGIPEASCCDTDQFEFNIITPYSAYPLFLFNQSIGSVWLWNMLKG